MKNTELIQSRILSDMSEGVFVVGFDGIICYINNAAQQIFKKVPEEILGLPFASVFFEFEENDAFNQTVLNAVYDRTHTHNQVVSYFDGEKTLQLHMTTSFLTNDGENVGIVCLFYDVTELAELRDALVAMEKIKKMNQQLEIRNELLSKTFGRFLSDDIVKQLIDTPDGLSMGGAKRGLSILMSDLRGFTAISESMGAANLIEMLNNYLATMTDCIQKHHGTIIEFIGDGIMAVFGAPVSSDCHADEAIAAAVEMQASMTEINRWNRERNYPTLQMGIGINTGDVIVGNIGSEKRTKYGTVGSQVNLAGRIESYTTGGQLLVSPATIEQAHAALTVYSTQSVRPKGVSGELVLSHVTGIGEPYSLSYCYSAEEPTALKTPASIQFVRINGKHVDEIPCEAAVTALCHSGALIRTESELELYDNIQLDIGGFLYAKVTEISEKGIKIIFTSFPVSFDGWLDKLAKKLTVEKALDS